jgi:hypothetical protein
MGQVALPCLLVFYILAITKITTRYFGLTGGTARAVIIARLSTTAGICKTGGAVAAGGRVKAVNISGAVWAVSIAHARISI